MLIQELILENFMSYEYARIPLKSGVNVVCGPNGAGKSSILLGISVALGQSYTERSRKLSNLIRWGKDQARVTIVLDNSPNKGKRPVPKLDKDQIFLTRGLRRDGKYWFELDNRAVTKRTVERMLAKFSVDPDNLLIIMHQNMTELFSVLSSQEKLRTVEEAVGLEPYRRNVLQARANLSHILSEEDSLTGLLESAEQTLNYWRGEYDRYQQKKQLQTKRRFLERELVWSKAVKKENTLNELRSKIAKGETELQQVETQTRTTQATLAKLQTRLTQLKSQWQEQFEERLVLERAQSKNEAFVTFSQQAFEEIRQFVENSSERISECIVAVEQLETSIESIESRHNPTDYLPQLTKIKMGYKNLEQVWSRRLNRKDENLKAQLESYNDKMAKANKHLFDIHQNIANLATEIENVTEQLIETKINIALLEYRKQNIESHIETLRRELKGKIEEYNEALKRAEQTGSRIASTRTADQILDEIRLTDGYLSALADVSPDVEGMYESYSKLYFDLKKKAQTVAENRERAMEEIDARMEAWQGVMKRLLDQVNLQYKKILSHAQAAGGVQLVDASDIEAAGLEVVVGFKGAEPVPLNAYTQSGGERSLATMSFLLALQQFVKSPFRAVDEYDVHMDPRNRETVTSLLIEQVEGLNSQYLIITPSQIAFARKDVHIITVQNVTGSSKIAEVI